MPFPICNTKMDAWQVQTIRNLGAGNSFPTVRVRLFLTNFQFILQEELEGFPLIRRPVHEPP